MTLLAMLLLAQAPGRMTMVKPLSCVALEEARGKTPAEVAQLIEQKSIEEERNGYHLVALLPGEVPVACYRSSADPGQMPRGKR